NSEESTSTTPILCINLFLLYYIFRILKSASSIQRFKLPKYHKIFCRRENPAQTSKTALQATARRLFALQLGNACFFLVNLCTSCAFVCNFPRFFGYSEGFLTNIHHRKEDFSFEQHET
ncbi:MAG: hypothetical protein II513_04005, partial [Ruminococcus sp.]|nr:hypothetical protein [Ruminococcus sp.]